MFKTLPIAIHLFASTFTVALTDFYGTGLGNSSMSTEASKVETIVSYAALILADEGLEITPERLQTLIAAANIEDVEPIWTTLFAKALQDKDVKDILTEVATSTQGVVQQQTSVDGNDKNEPDQGEDTVGQGAADEESDEEVMCFIFD